MKEPKERKPNPRAVLIDLFNKKYKDELGEDNPYPFAVCMNAMLHFRYVDKETGEVFTTYPTVEAWQKELDGFFRDDFARDHRGFHFTYFIKQFGSFAKRVRQKKTQTMHLVEYEDCDRCFQPYIRGTVHQCTKEAV